MGNPAIVSTITHRDVGNLSTVQKPDYDKIMHLAAPNETSLTLLFKKFGKESAMGNRTFRIFDDEHPAHYVTVNASETAAVEGLTVDSNAGARRMDIYQNERTGEQILIEAIGSTATELGYTTTTGIERGYGATSAAAMQDGDILIRLGNAAAEGQKSGDFIHTTAGYDDNYIHEFRTPIVLTEDAMEAENYTGKDWPYQKAKALSKHSWDIERQYLFGEPYSGTISGATTGILGAIGGSADTAIPVYTTGGVRYWINLNGGADRNWNVGGTLTEASFIKQFLSPTFEFGGQNKVGFFATDVLFAPGYWG